MWCLAVAEPNEVEMTRSETRKRHHALLESEASVEEAGSLAKPKAVLLLWFLRNVVGVGDLDAYDFICDGDNDKGIDGLYLEPSAAAEDTDTLVIYQSKFTETPTAKAGPTDIDRLAGAATHFHNVATYDDFLSGSLEESLRALLKSGDLKLRERIDSGDLGIRLVFVTAGMLNADAKRKVSALQELHGKEYIRVWTIDELGPRAEVVRSPERLAAQISVPCPGDSVLVTGIAPNRVAVLPILASEVASWPGIEDRSLFALNIRHELRQNKVSKGLDRAIATPTDHSDFLAYHNGLTVICDEFKSEDGTLEITNPSVVNGAQSVLAFSRGARDTLLSVDLRVFAKIVEVKGRPQLAKEVSRRSNTQTSVNPRNLMANSGPQLRLARELDALGVFYETRPDTLAADGVEVIKNDDAAQLLCAVYNARPWLAVKRLTLFESDSHALIFSEHITGKHLVLVTEIRKAVESQRDRVPEVYRASWKLTTLIACYLVGEIARAAEEDGNTMLFNPANALADIEKTQASLRQWAKVAAIALREWHEEQDQMDNYKKDFKNQARLTALGSKARKAYRILELASAP